MFYNYVQIRISLSVLSKEFHPVEKTEGLILHIHLFFFSSNFTTEL